MEKTLLLASIGAIFMVASAIPRSSIYNSEFHDEYYPGLRQFDNSQKGAMLTKAECESNWQVLKDDLCADCCDEVLHLWNEKRVTDCMDGWMSIHGTFMKECDAKCERKDSIFRKNARNMMVADSKRLDRNPFLQYRRRDYGSPNDQKKSMYGRIKELYDYQRPLRRRHDFE